MEIGLHRPPNLNLLDVENSEIGTEVNICEQIKLGRVKMLYDIVLKCSMARILNSRAICIQTISKMNEHAGGLFLIHDA